ncbi:hypothetical protein GCM10023075_37060 [Streptosporangium album]
MVVGQVLGAAGSRTATRPRFWAEALRSAVGVGSGIAYNRAGFEARHTHQAVSACGVMNSG